MGEFADEGLHLGAEGAELPPVQDPVGAGGALLVVLCPALALSAPPPLLLDQLQLPHHLLPVLIPPLVRPDHRVQPVLQLLVLNQALLQLLSVLLHLSYYSIYYLLE